MFYKFLYFFKDGGSIVPTKTKGVAHGHVHSMVYGFFDYDRRGFGNIGIYLHGVDGRGDNVVPNGFYS